MSATEKRLGKIERAHFGLGGYQQSQFGLFLLLSSPPIAIGTMISGGWGTQIKATEHTEWTEEDRIRGFGEACVKINNLLNDAKVTNVAGLVGIPVEVELLGLELKDWRVLKEVL